MLALTDATVRIGPATLLSEVSLDVRPGEVLAVVGPNGAGKTTALRVIAGETPPTTGGATLEGRPLAEIEPLDPLELIRAIATARLMMPKSMVRLSAGRLEMDASTQALCFLAGANSIFFGDTLLTTGNPAQQTDRALFDKLGVRPMPIQAQAELPAAE